MCFAIEKQDFSFLRSGLFSVRQVGAISGTSCALNCGIKEVGLARAQEIAEKLLFYADLFVQIYMFQ